MGPCGWDINPDCADWAAASPGDRTRAEELAVFVLWSLTGRVFGVCDQVIRPCFRRPDDSTTYRGRSGGAGMTFWPGLINGTWVNGACGCSNDCACVPASMLALPGPIVSVTSVVIDGAVLAPEEYRIKGNRWLVRIGAEWPQDQDLEAADDEPGAFTVSYKRGVKVPGAGVAAAEVLACDFVRAITGGECAIPSRAVSVARQGMDIQLLDPAQYFTAGLTGLPIVDAWITAVNPGRIKSPPKVFNIDAMRTAGSRIR